MKKFFKFLLYLILGLAGVVLLAYLGFNIYFWVINRQARSKLAEVKTLHINGRDYRDLNKNGKLDIYEDPDEPVDRRIEDLLSQMTTEEKAGMMFQPMIGIGENGELATKPGFMNFSSSIDQVVNDHLRHFNIFMTPDATNLARWYNNLQKLAEQTRLGIPVTISSDPRHGYNHNPGAGFASSDFSKWPEPIGLAATRDSLLVLQFGQIANREYRAVGIRTALHPMADLATEPRWARINGTFGQDAALASMLTTAYIYGFQGPEIGPESVACMIKHFSGGGPQKDGLDAHFSYGKEQVYPGNNFKYHLIPFETAFKSISPPAMVMPYYGIPMDQTSENVGFAFNKDIITGLLRDKYHYDGVVCSDWGILEGFGIFGFELVEGKSWGVENLTLKQKILKALHAGIDQFGGNDNVKELTELIEDGEISRERIDASVRRLLKVKFELGLFDNPYVNAEDAAKIAGKAEFVQAGALAQRKSLVLLKNRLNPDSTHILPLHGTEKIYVEDIDKKTASEYGTVADSLADADVAIIRINAPYQIIPGDMLSGFFHQGDLDFKEPELSRILKILETKPTIVCIYLDRPAVIPEIAIQSAALLANFGAEDDALLDVIYGRFNPGGKLPFTMPSSMEAVKNQKEDVPGDSKNPLFPFGAGLTYE